MPTEVCPPVAPEMVLWHLFGNVRLACGLQHGLYGASPALCGLVLTRFNSFWLPVFAVYITLHPPAS